LAAKIAASTVGATREFAKTANTMIALTIMSAAKSKPAGKWRKKKETFVSGFRLE